MKANAPEKIYLTSDENNSYVFIQKRSDNIGVEYTRTDSFIEKACEFIKNNGSHYIDIVNGQLVLKKGIINDFKKYMKGEINME